MQGLLDVLTRFETLAYLVAALLFILALANLSKQKTALSGNRFGMIGMGLALVAVIVVALVQSQAPLWLSVVLMAAALVVGRLVRLPCLLINTRICSRLTTLTFRPPPHTEICRESQHGARQKWYNSRDKQP